MSTFADDIEEAVGQEVIEAIVVYSDTWDDSPINERSPDARYGVAVGWDEAKPWLSYDFDRGYGGQDCHNVHIWTATRVFYVEEYDGATGLASVPRNPPVPA